MSHRDSPGEVVRVLRCAEVMRRARSVPREIGSDPSPAYSQTSLSLLSPPEPLVYLIPHLISSEGCVLDLKLGSASQPQGLAYLCFGKSDDSQLCCVDFKQ